MKIPKKFKLFGSTVSVEFNSDKLEKEKCIGLSEYNKHLITLTKINEAGNLSDDSIIDTFYHEKVHMILDAMHERKISSNEQFVDVFAKLLRQADDSAEY